MTDSYLFNGLFSKTAGPYTNHLHLDPDRRPCHQLITQFFTGWMTFLRPDQQCQSTEGNHINIRNAELIRDIKHTAVELILRHYFRNIYRDFMHALNVIVLWHKTSVSSLESDWSHQPRLRHGPASPRSRPWSHFNQAKVGLVGLTSGLVSVFF